MMYPASSHYGLTDPCSPVSGYIPPHLSRFTPHQPMGCVFTVICGVLAIVNVWHPSEDLPEQHPAQPWPERPTICASGGLINAFTGRCKTSQMTT